VTTSPPKLAPADDFYLAAHDGIGGRSLLSARTLGTGLGAALLGELLFWRRLHLAGDTLHVADARPTGDPATSIVLARMAALPGPHGLGRWIAHLAAGLAEDLVVQRLTTAGVLRAETRRRLLTTSTTIVFTGARSTGEPAGRLRTRLSYNERLDTADLMLAGLILATGLDEFVLDTCIPRDRARLSDQFRRHMPPVLNDLVAHTRMVTTAEATVPV
jgi:hypothetical protein